MDLSHGPKLHYECFLSQKMEKIFSSKDGLYTIILFSDERTVIILNNILKKIQL